MITDKGRREIKREQGGLKGKGRTWTGRKSQRRTWKGYKEGRSGEEGLWIAD